MGDKQTERALASERQRHTEAAMALARRIRDDAADALRALASGSIPTRHLVQDAVELDKRCTALATESFEASRAASEASEASEAAQAPPPPDVSSSSFVSLRRRQAELKEHLRRIELTLELAELAELRDAIALADFGSFTTPAAEVGARYHGELCRLIAEGQGKMTGDDPSRHERPADL